ncbi:MAG: flagellar basal body rod protein FlgB [Propionivibrio sp.]|nr:flagellar basal body rod protein FlgB [Propionivibrio sp.]
MVSKLDNALEFQQVALGLRAHRQQILAGNIANADTPHYKARDFDFSTALRNAVAGRGSGAGLQLVATSDRHLQGTSNSGPVRLQYRTPPQDSADGNTVDMDLERASFSENAIQYDAGLTFITGKIKTLMSAIQG